MKTFLRIVMLLSLAIACGWPDVLPPPPKGERITMRVVQDGVAGGPVLEIPARLLRQHAALLDLAPGFPRGNSGGIRMLVAGVLLSAAIFFLGRAVWKRRERNRLPVIVAVGSLLAAGALISTASADDQGRYNPGTLNVIGEKAPYEGTVAVQITNSGDAVILHLTPPRRPIFRPHPVRKP